MKEIDRSHVPAWECRLALTANSARRWSVACCIPTLERGNDPVYVCITMNAERGNDEKISRRAGILCIAHAGSQTPASEPARIYASDKATVSVNTAPSLSFLASILPFMLRSMIILDMYSPMPVPPSLVEK